MSLFGGPPGAGPAVGSAQDDVLTRPPVDDIVTVQAEQHIVALPAREHVGPVQRLVCDGATLDRGVVLSVIVEPDEELRPFAAVGQCGLRGMRRDQERAEKRGGQAGGNAPCTDTGERLNYC